MRPHIVGLLKQRIDVIPNLRVWVSITKFINFIECSGESTFFILTETFVKRKWKKIQKFIQENWQRHQ